MTVDLYPPVQERNRPAAVSNEAEFVSQCFMRSHDLFIGNSVIIHDMYSQQLMDIFNFLKSIWLKETILSSSVSDITNNSAYRGIIGLGKDVIPFIIQDLKTNNNHWFNALEALTGENPIKNNHKGILPLMKNDWLEWAEKNSYTNERFITWRISK
jgi:hypothetical protein